MSKLAELNGKIEKLEDRLMNDEIEPSTYKNWFQKFTVEKSLVLKEIENLEADNTDKWKRLEKLMPELKSLKNIHERLKTPAARNRMLKTVFQHNIVYSERGFGTPSISEAFKDNWR